VHAIEKTRAALAELDQLPLPGAGATLARWRALAALGREDLSVARLAEGHADAVAILRELDHPVPDGLLGVWAAQPDRLTAEPSGAGWVLRGEKAWCSGSLALDRALVTATAPDGPRLFVVGPGGLEIVPGSWTPMGMEATRSDTLVFDAVRVGADDAVGGPGAYVERPGFGHGGCGVAAVWWGGADAVADALRLAAGPGAPDDVLAALGEVTADLDAAWAVLAVAAAEVDAHPGDRDRADRRALAVRLAVERSARHVLDLTTRSLGAAALCHRPAHAARVADLTVYLSQLHPARSAVALGRTVSGTAR
jgi:alkylation response protein AidB-like acyl-CoA dehydrogenase